MKHWDRVAIAPLLVRESHLAISGFMELDEALAKAARGR